MTTSTWSTFRFAASIFAVLAAFEARAQDTWTAMTPVTTQNLWSVTSGGGQFVAVGEASAVVSSPDGISWVSRPVSPAGYWLVSVGYGAGMWVIVGDKGLILTSTNLVSWTVRTSGTSSRINGVAYGGGRWIAVAESGELLTSIDGINWSTLKPSGDRLHGIVYAYGQFVITGDDGLVRTTIDVTDYAERTLPGSMFLEVVTYARRAFVAIGEGGFAVRSSDGVNWDPVNTGNSSHFRGLAYFNNQFIAAGTDGAILTASDPSGPWVQRRSGTSALLTSAAASDSAAVIVGFGGTVLRSAPAASATVIVTGPRSLTEALGSNVLLDVVASGSLPLSYQWSFYGQAIAAATSDRLFLPDVQSAQAGNYSVRVTNAQGSATSATAVLRLVASTEPGPIVDESFEPKLSLPNGIAAAVEQADGKIVIGGSQFFVTPGVSPFALARLNRDGSLDPTFAIGTGLNSGGSVSQLVLQPDGKIIIAGGFQTINGVNRANVARLNSDGSVDLAFTAASVVSVSPPQRVELQFGEKLIALTGTTLVRLNKDGSLDSSFVGSALGLSIADFGLFSDGSLAVAITGGPVHKLSPFGALVDAASPLLAQPEFGVLLRYSSLVSTPDGQVFSIRSSISTRGSSGSFDRFQLLPPSTVSFDLSFRSMDGKEGPFYTALFSGQQDLVYISRGLRSTTSSLNRDVLTRRRMSGSVDRSFDTRTGPNGTISSVFALRDGGVLVTGSFTTFDGIARPNLVRLVAANAFEGTPPTLVTTTPEAAAVLPGTAVPLAVVAAGSSPLTYSWSVRGRDGNLSLSTAEAASPSLRFLPLNPGVYTASVTVTNRAGTATSVPIRITVADSAPAVVSLPSTVTAFSGRNVTLTVTAAGTPPLTYQWYRGDVLVGSSSSLTIPRAGSANQGDYTAVISNSLGRTTSLPVRLTVDATARLANISTRTGISPDRPLIAGFVITGGGQRVLVRGVGPGLAAFGITGTLPDPTISLVDSSGRAVASNNNFDSNPNGPTPGGLVEGVGAFRLTSSLDAAFVATLPAGAYTVQLADTASRSGVGLLEVYRADDSPTRLVNLSSRGFVGTGAALAIAGIAVEGELPRQFLIRGVGPVLQAFGVGDALADPVLNLTSATGESLFRNDDWGTSANAPELVAISSRLGTFPLATGSKDAALLVTLAPGNYTALVNGVGDTTGTALIEVYEVP